ncbi:MAG: molybdate ABC transporter substrate-binding protein [Bacteroidota bacterium]
MSRRLLLLFSVLLYFSCSQSDSPVLRIATAANVQYAMDSLVQVFATQTGIETQIILNSSGKLATQIIQGAPYDVFVSANMTYPNFVRQNGKTDRPPTIYAHGTLVIWTADKQTDISFEQLPHQEIRHIAIANPKTAPYGKAAMEVLQGQDLMHACRDKLIFGESISQTNQFILTRHAEVGFTAKSVVLAPTLKEVGRWQEVDQALYAPITQGVIIIQRGQTDKQLENAQTFYNFLLSPTAQAILGAYGYRSVNV